MGGSKSTNAYSVDVIVLAGQEDQLIHYLCADAQFEVETAEEYIKSSAVLLGKLYSECKDFMNFHKWESEAIINRFMTYCNLDVDFECSAPANLKEVTEELAKMVIISKLCDRKGQKLKNRCLKEIKVTQLAVADVTTNEIINEEEFYELYGVDPDFMISYVIPKLCLIEEMVSSTIVYSQQILYHFQERLKLIERRIELIKERNSLTDRIKSANLKIEILSAQQTQGSL